MTPQGETRQGEREERQQLPAVGVPAGVVAEKQGGGARSSALHKASTKGSERKWGRTGTVMGDAPKPLMPKTT
ncbi:MAG: hypothetical protein AB1830_13685 [Pseudomonadota bacterium]